MWRPLLGGNDDVSLHFKWSKERVPIGRVPPFPTTHRVGKLSLERFGDLPLSALRVPSPSTGFDVAALLPGHFGGHSLDVVPVEVSVASGSSIILVTLGPAGYPLGPAAEGQQPGEGLEPEHPVGHGQVVLPGDGDGDVALEVVEHVPPPHLPEVVLGVARVLEHPAIVGHGVVDVPQPGGDPVGDHHVDRVVAPRQDQEQDAGEREAEGGVVQQEPSLGRVCKRKSGKISCVIRFRMFLYLNSAT